MGVRKKGKRKIIYDNNTYIWYVALDHDSPDYILNIMSQDKQFIIACALTKKSPYIISKGSRFQKNRMDGRWHRYRLPFDIPEIITPKFVSKLIEWTVKGEEAVEIEWNGEDVSI